ncbi:hypothetical protein V9T40_001932 [Parthenolecanium corni]|uniref:THAP-type domain-containing protein n=1 Tax=Parthenolecanium corni TaxID=536013 RepID=A0AAN9THG6_9HEMI
MPKDLEMRQVWERNMRRLDRPLTNKDRICERHFQEEFIQRYYETRLPNGDVCKIDRGKPTLTENAVPTIIPGAPAHCSKIIKTRKNPMERKIPLKRKREEKIDEVRVQEPGPSNYSKKTKPEPSIVDDVSELPVEFTNLVECLKKNCIQLPTDWIFNNLCDRKCILLMAIEENFNIKKKIVIFEDLTFRVYLGNVITNIEDFTHIKSTTDVNKLLQIVAELKVCSNAMNQKILPLPSPATIHRHMRKLKPSFGFQNQIFNTMKVKSEGMRSIERRGVLLLDEMKLSPSVRFDKSDLKILGFVDLGKYTPADQVGELGDHALVIMFQPFVGKWVQSLACFLSRGAANGVVLTQIILEAIILLGNANFYVHGITTDGATWNRSMWRNFGVSEASPSTTNPSDETKKIYFFSDFPHLMKCLWCWVISKDEFTTPDGIVKKQHWEVVIKEDSKRQIKALPRLNNSHLQPKQYEKMNTAKAYQFFSREVASVMELYSIHTNYIPDGESTRKFITRMSALIHAFSSRTPKGALTMQCPERDVIKEFLEFLNQSKNFMTQTTLHGFKISCQAALQLSEDLINNYGFSYVMTARLNQDNLERFFGMIRASCGNSDHPDPTMFLLVFRLLSTYSLIKPTPGSNVTGEELFETLFKIEGENYDNLPNASESAKEKWTAMKNLILSKGEVMDDFHQLETEFEVIDLDDNCLQYLAGFAARKAANFSTCTNCRQIIVSENANPLSLIALRNYYDVLHIPSDIFFALINSMEKIIKEVVGPDGSQLTADTFFSIAERMAEEENIVKVGCEEHADNVTQRTMDFYLVMRMNFLCQDLNKKFVNKTKHQELRKVGKLVQAPNPSLTRK